MAGLNKTYFSGEAHAWSRGFEQEAARNLSAGSSLGHESNAEVIRLEIYQTRNMEEREGDEDEVDSHAGQIAWQ